jgi:hypothetical protein
MTTREALQWDRWRGFAAYDPDDNKVGTIEDIYVDDESGQPEWLAIKTGLFGMKVSFVPIKGTRTEGDRLIVAFDKDTIKHAPNIDPNGHMSQEDERKLYEHYGLNYRSYEPQRRGLRDDTVETDTMTTTSQEPVERHEQVRLRKRQWVENVPVQKEDVVVEREPLDETTRRNTRS